MEQSKSSSTPPYKTLGSHLKYLREQQQESLAEVSGAVEIDEAALARIEHGDERPSEDILMLLITHYDMQDQEAVQLWELAGYDRESAPRGQAVNLEDLAAQNKGMVMLLATDMRTMYSDGLDITVNQAGMTLTFTQATGPDKRMPVGKIGMSHEQAKQVLQTLQQAILKADYMSGPHRLPSPEDRQN